MQCVVGKNPLGCLVARVTAVYAGLTCFEGRLLLGLVVRFNLVTKWHHFEARHSSCQRLAAGLIHPGCKRKVQTDGETN